MERLTAQDLSMVWPDDLGWPQDIGVIALLDGIAMIDRRGRFCIEDARTAIEHRLPRVRRFRQVLLTPRYGLGWPMWVDAPAVDLTHHVRVLDVPAPADDQQMLRVVERLRRRRLDRSRPLWEMWFLTGLPDGRVAWFVRVHHAIADGVAGVGILEAFLDTQPTVPTVSPTPWTPESAPTARELFLDNGRRRIRELTRAVAAIVHLGTTLRNLRDALPVLREVLAEGSAPRTSLNRPIGQGRTVALVRGSLDLTKRIAHTHGGTVNDVLMAAMAGGLRDLLRARGEPTDIVLRAYVPVALHRERRGEPRANTDGMMVVRLPLGIADPAQRLREIAAETARRRKLRRPAGGSLLRFGLLQRTLLKLMARQRWANVYAANVPGPAARLYVAGAPVLELFPLVPLIGNITLGVGALSYTDQFNITAVADECTCPDLDVFVRGVDTSMRSLADSLSATHHAPTFGPLLPAAEACPIPQARRWVTNGPAQRVRRPLPGRPRRGHAHPWRWRS
jgi:diacylglycerol O-acyltransferase